VTTSSTGTCHHGNQHLIQNYAITHWLRTSSENSTVSAANTISSHCKYTVVKAGHTEWGKKSEARNFFAHPVKQAAADWL